MSESDGVPATSLQSNDPATIGVNETANLTQLASTSIDNTASATPIEKKSPDEILAAREDGLRRSGRVPKPRTDLTLDLEDEYKKRVYKKRPKPKPKQKEKKSKAKGKKKVTKPAKKATGKAASKKDSDKKGGKNANGKTSSQSDAQEPSLSEQNWSPCVPLLNSDFKTQQSVSSRLKNPNMKATPYAGDVMKIMSFVNKYYSLFDQDLLNISFQDFEVGLDIYPGNPKGTAEGIFSKEKNRMVYYQDIILVKEVIKSQDKMNLLFLTLLQLLFDNPKKYEPPTLSDLSGKNIYRSLVAKLRKSAIEWGYPKEWRASNALPQDTEGAKTSILQGTHDVSPVDLNNREVLTPGLYTYQQNEPLSLELDPLQTRALDDDGILGLNSMDRIILLRTLTNWCSIQSLLVHHEVYQLTHLKREPTFGIQSQHVARYYLDGPEKTLNYFRKLCTIVQARFEIRAKKKHYRKQINDGSNTQLIEKMRILGEIKEEIKACEKSQKDEMIISLYDKWDRLFDGELPDNPLSNPFEDPIYTLRSQEFFVGRVPYMGDFYLPRLHTYGDAVSMSMYTDLRSLQTLVSKFKNKEYTVFHLFEEYGQTLSPQFKVLYHDTPSLLHDVAKNKRVHDKCYWYEMCYDAESLREFLDFLDYKIVAPPPKEPKKEVSSKTEEGTAPQTDKKEASVDTIKLDSTPIAQAHDTVSVDSAETKVETKNIDVPSSTGAPSKKKENPNVNLHPLPRDVRYNASRNKLKILKEYLSDFYYILYTFEQLKNEYADMKPGRRQLRDLKRNIINYNLDYESDEDMLD